MRDPDSVMRSGRTLGEQLGSGQLEYWFVPLLFMRLVGVLTGYGAKLNFETGDEEHKTHCTKLGGRLTHYRACARVVCAHLATFWRFPDFQTREWGIFLYPFSRIQYTSERHP